MRYKLPEALGGGEFEGTETSFAGDQYAWFNVDGLTFSVRLDNLTPVEPPLPPEPPEGSVVLDAKGRAWQNAEPEWYCAHQEMDQYWPGLQAYGPLTLLVPDPFAEHVELPWKSGMGPELAIEKAIGCGCHGETDGAQLIGVVVGDQSAHVQPQEARTFARALWSAANMAEAVT